MKNIYMILLAAVLGCHTKEKIIDQQKSLIIAAMTSGQWKVTSFKKGGTDITSSFSPYSFQFKDNYTVDALNNGSVVNTGSWQAAGTVQAQTISASFSNATDPLVLLNGTWNIINTTWTSVQASQTVGSELRELRLDKL